MAAQTASVLSYAFADSELCLGYLDIIKELDLDSDSYSPPCSPVSCGRMRYVVLSSPTFTTSTPSSAATSSPASASPATGASHATREGLRACKRGAEVSVQALHESAI